MDTQQAPKPPSYSKLKNGDWGVRLEGSAQPGQIINVTTKSGQVKPEKLGRKIWEGDGVQLYAIDKDDTEEVPF